MSSSISSTSGTTGTTPSTTSAAVTSTGIGSGLNVTAIVSALTTAFGSAQQTQLTNQGNTLDAQVSAFGTFQSALDTLQAAVYPLESPTSLATFQASVADQTVATASASTGAVAGSYAISVQNLATADTLTSAPVASSTSTVGTGTLQISVGGNSSTITVDSNNDTLAGIAASINGAADNPGVSASIITSSDGSRLVLTSNATGAANAITVGETDGGDGLASLTYDPNGSANGLTQTTQAKDANFTVNTYPATSASNVVSGAISGVTLNLVGASASGTSTTLTVSPDTTAATTSINKFVTALNGVLSSIQTLTSYNATTQTAGALQGNATLQSFQNQIENILGSINSSNPGGVTSLAQLGITIDANTGATDSNSQTLANALNGSLSSVVSLLTGPKGFATQINSLVNQYTSAGGLLTSINDGLQTGLKNVATQQANLTAELATYSATLTTQYNAMDTAVAALKQTQTYLTAQFSASSGTSSSSSSSLSSGTTST